MPLFEQSSVHFFKLLVGLIYWRHLVGHKYNPKTEAVAEDAGVITAGIKDPKVSRDLNPC